MSEPEGIPPGVDPTKPSAGRLYDYYLGGTENLEVDRRAGEMIREKMPELEDGAWANREAAQSVAPDARTVYVDNDPMVLAHARSLLGDTPNTAFITVDRSPTSRRTRTPRRSSRPSTRCTPTPTNRSTSGPSPRLRHSSPDSNWSSPIREPILR